jgi:lipopolysaccharide transport system ATP-binding protein
MHASEAVAIRVENLSKEYFIGRDRRGEKTFREALSHAVTAPFRRAIGRSFATSQTEKFWALKDVNFEVRRGEVVGIIGRNGAGKSTLFKILSRITAPTEGRIEIRGRVASLLEVGTGFHGELTGRENIYLNGAILGMTRAEINRKFHDIVGFAEVGKFINTPVKHYSSGMYVRLAFGVAAYLDSDILIVDEVLAVGDVEFQKKSLRKMSEIAEDGRTVLFVSHNTMAVNRLCGRCLLLDSGRIVAQGDSESITAQYVGSSLSTKATREWEDPKQRPGNEIVQLLSVCVRQCGKLTDTVDIRLPIEVELTYETLEDNANLLSGVSFFNAEGVHLFLSADLHDAVWSQPRGRGVYRSLCHVPGNVFAEGLVRVSVEVSARRPLYRLHFLEPDSVGFQVVDRGQPGSVRGDWEQPFPGVMRPICEWKTETIHLAELPLPGQIASI